MSVIQPIKAACFLHGFRKLSVIPLFLFFFCIPQFASGDVYLTEPVEGSDHFDLAESSAVLVGGSLVATVNEALVNHPQIAVQRNELRAAGYEVDAALWGRWPTFGLETRALSDGYEVTASVEQPVWSGGRITGQIDSTRAREVLALARLEEIRNDVALEVSSAFFEVLRLQERVSVALRNEREHRKLLKMIQRRVASEINPTSDAVLAESRMRRAVTTRVQTERQLREARTTLARGLGRSVTLSELAAPSLLALDMNDPERLIEKALAFSPARQRLEAELEGAAAEVKLARAQTMPTVVIGFERTLSNVDSDRVDDERAYLALNVQTGAGLSGRATVSAATQRRLAARDAIADQVRQLRQQMESLIAEVVSLQTQIDPMKSIVFGSEAMVDSYLNQFQVGKKSWLDVLNAQNEKAQAYFLRNDIEMPLMRARFHLILLAGLYKPVSTEVLRP